MDLGSYEDSRLRALTSDTKSDKVEFPATGAGEPNNGKEALMQVPWYESQDDVLAFARVMVDDSRIQTLDEALHYFEKPFKWDREHKIWEDHDMPFWDDDTWVPFSADIDRLWELARKA
jgi:hypothetical protein